MALTAIGQPHGFFTQYDYANRIRPVVESYLEVEKLFDASNIADFMAEIKSNIEVFKHFGESATDPIFGRGMFPPLDGMAAYVAVRRFKPARIVEIGSGDSTHFLVRDLHDNKRGVMTCIDPQPRRDIISLGVDFKRRLLSAADTALIASLEENDILFIDSSHIMLPGLDVDIIFNRLFPKLRKGVIVHIHDIFLPDGYPTHWKAWNFSEQNALIGWLLSGYFAVIWAGRYVVTRRADLISAALRDFAAMERAGTLWLRRA